MKNNKLPKWMFGALLIAISFNACGKKSSSATGSAASTNTVGVTNTADPVTPTYTNTSTSTSTSTNTSVAGDPPLSFEINSLTGTQQAQTPAIRTDGVLKVKFQVTPGQGNNVHQASELAVEIWLNNATMVVPKYTSNNYSYGRVGETSNVIDLSGYVTQGQNVTLTVKNPKNDFYCTYSPNPFYYWDGGQWAPTNPLYNTYPGCRKAVFTNHVWSGIILVQTSGTSAI